MPSVILQQTAWNAGEFSPRMFGRNDFPRYAAGAKRMENVILHVSGGFQKRSGTRYVYSEDPTKRVRLVRFVFSNDDAYVLAIQGADSGIGTVHFYRNLGIITVDSQTFAGGANPPIDTGAETITFSSAHFFATGQGPFRLTAGAGGLPAGLSAVTDYYVRAVSSTVIALYTTSANAISDTSRVNITSVGGAGPHTIAAKPNVTVPAQVNHTFLESELAEFQWAQSADVMYLVHKLHAPSTLSRTGHADWAVADITFEDGPWDPLNSTQTTLTVPGGSAGDSKSISTSAAVFDASRDIGRMLRVQCGNSTPNWGWMVITAVADSTHATATYKVDISAATSISWQFGAFYAANYPNSVVIAEQRLGFGGTPSFAETLHLSISGRYYIFAYNGDYTTYLTTKAATDLKRANGAVNDSNALSLTFGSAEVMAIRFLANAKNLMAGTIGGLWPVRGGANDLVISPTNASTRRTSAFGAALRMPAQTDDLVVYVSRERTRLRAAGYQLSSDAYEAADLNRFADHLGRVSQFAQIAYQEEPYPTIWATRDDGVVPTCTISQREDVLGWARQIIGGSFGTGGAVVEDVAVIPTQGGDQGQVWLAVKRTINGATVRSIEVMDPMFEDGDAIEDAFFVDMGATVKGTEYTITAVSIAATATCTVSSAAGLSNGDRIRITGVVGVSTTDSYGTVTSLVNGKYFLVANLVGTTFDLHDLSNVAYPTTGGVAYVSGGIAAKTVTGLTGLTWLEGQSVAMLADGSVQTGTVSGGALTLATPAAKIQVGLPYTSVMESLPAQVDDPSGSGQGRLNRPAVLVLRLLRTSHLKAGRSGSDLDALPEVEVSTTPLTVPSVLFSGDVRMTIPGGWERGQGVILSHELPLPWEQVSVMARVESSG